MEPTNKTKKIIISSAFLVTTVLGTAGGMAIENAREEKLTPDSVTQIELSIKEIDEGGMYQYYLIDEIFNYPIESKEGFETFAFVLDRDGNRVKPYVDEDDPEITVRTREFVRNMLETMTVDEFIETLKQ